MYVLDTDVCIDIMRGRGASADRFARLQQDDGRLAVAAITAHELWSGAYRARNREPALDAVDRFLDALEILPFDASTAQVAGRVEAELASNSIGDLDTLIAATALTHDAKLVTRNRRHFARVAGLAIHSLE